MHTFEQLSKLQADVSRDARLMEMRGKHLEAATLALAAFNYTNSPGYSDWYVRLFGTKSLIDSDHLVHPAVIESFKNFMQHLCEFHASQAAQISVDLDALNQRAISSLATGTENSSQERGNGPILPDPSEKDDMVDSEKEALITSAIDFLVDSLLPVNARKWETDDLRHRLGLYRDHLGGWVLVGLAGYYVQMLEKLGKDGTLEQMRGELQKMILDDIQCGRTKGILAKSADPAPAAFIEWLRANNFS